MPCTSWPGLDKLPSEKRAQARKELIWLARIRERNRRNQAELDWKKIRRSQSKPNRARSGWLTFAGTTAHRTLSSRAGNGSLAGAAARSFTPRRIVRAMPASGIFPRHRGEAPHRLLINPARKFSGPILHRMAAMRV